jgi:hypothetical protein
LKHHLVLIREKSNIEACFSFTKRINTINNRTSNGIVNCLPAYAVVSLVIDEQKGPSGQKKSSKMLAEITYP